MNLPQVLILQFARRMLLLSTIAFFLSLEGFSLRAALFDFRAVYSGGVGPNLAGHLRATTSDPDPWSYSIDAPRAPFVLRSGALSGSLKRGEEVEVVFGFEAPTTDLVKTHYEQVLKLKDRANWILRANVLGPGIPPVAVISGTAGLGGPVCVGVPIQFEGTASYDPDYVGNGSLGIKRYAWTLSSDNGYRNRMLGKEINFSTTTPGHYVIELEVTDDEQQVGSTTRSFEVPDPIVRLRGGYWCALWGATHELARGKNGWVEIQCVNNAFQVRWRGNEPDCRLRFIAACRYYSGTNMGLVEMDHCSGDILRVCWMNRERNPGDPNGACPTLLDNDFYCFDVKSCTLTIIKRCQAVDLLGRASEPVVEDCSCLGSGPTVWSTEDRIYAGLAPISDPDLRCKFGKCPEQVLRPSGTESRGPSTFADLIGMPQPGHLALRIAGQPIVLALSGGESAETVAHGLVAAINTNLPLAGNGITAQVRLVLDSRVEIEFENVGDWECEWETLGQSASGLRVAQAGEYPWLESRTDKDWLELQWHPVGRRYVLETAEKLSAGSEAWAEVPAETGSIKVPFDQAQGFYRVRFKGRPSAISRPAGLRSWWAGDGNARDLASTNHGSFGEGMRFEAGMVGWGFSFDGRSGFVDCGEGGAVTGTNAFAVALWLRSIQTTTGTIIAQHSSTNALGTWSLSLASGKLTWRIIGDREPQLNIVAKRMVGDGTMHHICAVREQDGTGRLYIDGTLDTAAFQIPSELTSQKISLGADLVDLATSAAPSFLCGVLDEVQIYERALTAAEVETIYNAGPSGITKFE